MFIEKIINEKLGDKFWTHVYFDNGTLWIPALWEQGFIAQRVVLCERTKYPFLRWDAAEKTIHFIERAMRGENVEMLCNLPEFGLTKQSSYKRLARVLKNSRPLNEQENAYARG